MANAHFITCLSLTYVLLSFCQKNMCLCPKGQKEKKANAILEFGLTPFLLHSFSPLLLHSFTPLLLKENDVQRSPTIQLSSKNMFLMSFCQKNMFFCQEGVCLFFRDITAFCHRQMGRDFKIILYLCPVFRT